MRELEPLEVEIIGRVARTEQEQRTLAQRLASLPREVATRVVGALASTVGIDAGAAPTAPPASPPLGSFPTPSEASLPAPSTPTIQRSLYDAGLTAFGASPVPMDLNPVFTSDFGMRRHPVLGRERMHYGQDIAAPGGIHGTPQYSLIDGEVVSARAMGDAGNVVEVRAEDGTLTRHFHLDGFAVEEGDRVKAGQPIGTTGATGLGSGAHAHVEMEDPQGNRLDPRPALNAVMAKVGVTPTAPEQIAEIAGVPALDPNTIGIADMARPADSYAGILGTALPGEAPLSAPTMTAPVSPVEVADLPGPPRTLPGTVHDLGPAPGPNAGTLTMVDTLTPWSGPAPPTAPVSPSVDEIANARISSALTDIAPPTAPVGSFPMDPAASMQSPYTADYSRQAMETRLGLTAPPNELAGPFDEIELAAAAPAAYPSAPSPSVTAPAPSLSPEISLAAAAAQAGIPSPSPSAPAPTLSMPAGVDPSQKVDAAFQAALQPTAPAPSLTPAVRLANAITDVAKTPTSFAETAQLAALAAPLTAAPPTTPPSLTPTAPAPSLTPTVSLTGVPSFASPSPSGFAPAPSLSPMTAGITPTPVTTTSIAGPSMPAPTLSLTPAGIGPRDPKLAAQAEQAYQRLVSMTEAKPPTAVPTSVTPAPALTTPASLPTAPAPSITPDFARFTVETPEPSVPNPQAPLTSPPTAPAIPTVQAPAPAPPPATPPSFTPGPAPPAASISTMPTVTPTISPAVQEALSPTAPALAPGAPPSAPAMTGLGGFIQRVMGGMVPATAPPIAPGLMDPMAGPDVRDMGWSGGWFGDFGLGGFGGYDHGHGGYGGWGGGWGGGGTRSSHPNDPTKRSIT